MWIGTENGLNRFDGQQFLVFRPGSPSRNLSHAHINSIRQDGAGRLWVATQNGVNILDAAADTLIVLLPGSYREQQQYPHKKIPSNLIWDMYIDRHDRVWMAPDSRDPCYYDSKTGRFTSFPWLAFLIQRFPGRTNKYNSIRKIYRKSENEIWLGTSAGLFSLETNTGVFTLHPSIEADYFTQLAWNEETQTACFIQNPGNHLQVLHAPTGQKKDIPFAGIPALKKNDGQAAIWLPAGNRLLQMGPSGKHLFSIGHETDNPASLPAGHLRTVFYDSTGIVWLGSNAGLSTFNAQPGPFHYTGVFGSRQTVSQPEKDIYPTRPLVHTVLYDDTRQCYYLSSPEKNQFIVINAATGQQKIYSSANGIPLASCSVLHRDDNGDIWVFANRRAFIYHPASEQFSNTPFQCEGSIVTDVARDKTGIFWVASFNDGIYRYQPSQPAVKLQEKTALRSDLPTSLCYDDSTNTLWIGTLNTGLCAYNAGADRFSYFIQSDKPGKIGASLVTDIVKSGGTLWIASHAGGLITYDMYGSRQFRQLTTLQGLPDNNLYSLAATPDGKIWGTTDNGLFAVDEKTGAVNVYGNGQGLPFSDFHSPLIHAGNGALLTAADKGFLHFKSAEAPLASAGFRVVINAINTAQGHALTVNGSAAPVQMPYLNNAITIGFAALSYAAPSLTRYHYKLDGLDAQWQSGTQTTVRYAQVPPGRYTFRVKAADYTGRWSANEAVVQVVITPPWWRTGWFGIIAAVAGSGITIFLVRRRIRSIRKKAAIEVEMQALREKALRAQMNPHFIFNSLNAIQELVVTENYQSSYEYLSKFSRLLRMVLHVSEKDLVPLAGELDIIELYLELESLRFGHSFSYEVTVAPSVDKELSLFPPMLSQPFIENAIWHGLRPKAGPKTLRVHFDRHNGYIQCTITDNGIGREAAAGIRSAHVDKMHLQSKGVELARQRLVFLRTAEGIDGSISFHDLKNAAGEAAGTQVNISIENTSL